MAGEATVTTDRRLGVSIVLGAIAAVGVIAMAVAPGELLGAAGFATAVLAGLALIVVIHLAGSRTSR